MQSLLRSLRICCVRSEKAKRSSKTRKMRDIGKNCVQCWAWSPPLSAKNHQRRRLLHLQRHLQIPCRRGREADESGNELQNVIVSERRETVQSETGAIYELWEEEPLVFPPHSRLYRLEL